MPVEIERKFLVVGESWRRGVKGVRYRQGYLSVDPHRNVRVRVGGEEAFLTVKGVTRGASRSEFEYPIPVAHADQMLDTLALTPLIEKVRYRVEHGGLVWEIDVFEGENEGLVVAEVELDSEAQTFSKPEWLGEEVTEDPRYYNVNLVAHPYMTWR